MEKDDLIYLCNTIGNLSGIPTRLFFCDEQVYYHSLVDLPKDPMTLYREQLWNIHEHIGYFITPYFNYYGVINTGFYRIVIGPTRQVDGIEQAYKAIAFQLDMNKEETEKFVAAMRNIVQMPLESILQMLCTVNFALNHEKIKLEDITIVDTEQERLRRQITEQTTDIDMIKAAKTGEIKPHGYAYASYDTEQQLMRLVTKGSTAALKEWISQAPAVRPGILSKDQLRQFKNIFIVSTTLASRAAIRGGLSEEDAFALSDAYIQNCELLNEPQQIINLQYRMIFDYTERVERLRAGKQPSQLAIQVANYVLHHMSEMITVNDLAKSLFMSRSRLSARFKEETGDTLTNFILREKTEEAKRLLRYTDKSASAIGTYLGFSSQGHFARVFKKYSGHTPIEYREKYTK